MDHGNLAVAPVAKPAWTSLEIAKLIVGILTPLALVFISNQLSSADKRRVEEAARSDRARAEQNVRFERVAEQRIRLWQTLGPQLNDIYAYLLYVGRWKRMTAQDVVTAKREADRVFYANRPFFSDTFVTAYEGFMGASFQTYNAMGTDAKPRTDAIFRQAGDAEAVSGDENSDAVHASYFRLLDAVADEFDLTVTPPAKRPQTPAEISAASR